MRNKYWTIVLLTFIISCTEEREFDYPLIQTGEVTNINDEGAIFHAIILDLSKDEITEYGFVWDSKSKPILENAEKVIIQESPKTGVISQNISTTLQNGIKYYVRAFMKNNSFISYGKAVSFTSLGSIAPQVNDFSPKIGNLNDTIMILGDNFSYRLSNNEVRFGEFQASIIKASQDTLLVLVPYSLDTKNSNISVSICNNKALSNESFMLISPVFEDFQNKIASFGSSISIYGENFMSNSSSLMVKFSNHPAVISELSNQKITVIVPDELNTKSCYIAVSMNNMTEQSTELFQLESLLLIDFFPKISLTGNTIICQGNNFSPIPQNNIVTIGSYEAKVIEASTNELKIKIPLQDSGFFDARDVNINIEVLGENYYYAETLLINDKWFRLNDSPLSETISSYSSSYHLANCFVYNGKAYIGLNNKSEFWEYDAVGNIWKRLSDFPGIVRYFGVGFAIENKIYFGTGEGDRQDLKDWWEYDITLNNWNQKNDFAGEERTGAVGFSFNNIGYVGTGFKRNVDYYHHGFNDFWKYSPISDTWMQSTDYPMYSNFGMWWGVAITNSDEAFVGLGNVRVSGDYEEWMFRYVSNSNTWQRISNYPFADVNNRPIGFELNGTAYIKTYYSEGFYYYDESTDSWKELQTDILSNYIQGIAFSIGNKAYVGLGQDNQIWEYDPSR